MNQHGNRDLGLELFTDGVKRGTTNPVIAYYIEYAHYLSNGGTPSGWEDLTPTDVLLMSAYRMSDREQELEASSILHANAISKIFSGDR